jgi:hypothetical protein
MGKAKDSINWFGNTAKTGTDTVKVAGSLIGVAVGLALVGATIGIAGRMFGGGSQ